MGNFYHKSRKIFDVDRRATQRPIQIHVLGDASTGKTTLVNCFLNEDETNKSKPYFEDDKAAPFNMINKEIVGKNKKTQLLIYDCDSTQSLGNKNLYGSTGTIICFSLDDQASFKSVAEYWIPELKKDYPQVPLLLVGTKKDTRDNARKIDSYVRDVQGRLLSDIYKLKGYIECSSISDFKVKEVFNTFISK